MSFPDNTNLNQWRSGLKNHGDVMHGCEQLVLKPQDHVVYSDDQSPDHRENKTDSILLLLLCFK